jgi:uncharacterized repeat protein (TIGR03803 family)
MSTGSHQENRILPLKSSGVIATLALALAFLLGPALSQPLQAQTYTVLYTFTGAADGANPYSGVTLDDAGNLYGTTFVRGDFKGCGLFHGCGVVYKVDPSGKQTVLHTFVGNSDGRQPYFGNLFRDNTGNLFGTTVYGGMKGDIGIGVAFKVAKTGQETVLHRFTGGGDDGQQPVAGLILDSDGNFYGATVAGGSANEGTVYRMSKSGKVTVLHSFTGSDGIEPTSWLNQDAAGNFYGTAITGGSTGGGTVFKITKAGKFTLVYTFKGAPDGGLPQGNLVIDKAGNIYGTTSEGGDAQSCPYFGCGVVFKIDTHGKEHVLHEFLWAEGCGPSGGVTSDAVGNLYGTAWSCGAQNSGSVFKVDKKGNFTKLYDFTGGTDGGFPFSSLSQDKAGYLYGTTNLGGLANGCDYASGCGVVFKLTP